MTTYPSWRRVRPEEVRTIQMVNRFNAPILPEPEPEPGFSFVQTQHEEEKSSC